MLQAIELTKKYGDQVALNGLNLTIQPGEVFCLLGQNGAGKTTTINLFLGFTGASSGQALVNGILVSPDQPQTRKFLAYIPEVVMLYANLTSLENLDFFSRIAGFNYKKETLETYLLQAGLQPEAFHKRIGNYSKGMRQKVGIAIAVAKNAAVILMDEPTSGLDPKATHEFSEIVKQLSQDGRTVFMATHDIFNAVNVGTRIGIMRQGSLIHTLNAKDISANDLQKLYLETI
ncbi:ABC transporter ATP-binding protein [Pedobacter cryoconitis]|uniref:ABC-2 type transport system ATP-binding protein n=1 Tax=Pedobacter cryoconitis TaxID=188932 RepID=A0A327SUB1_9SPHI|nr:ABC transporter ATP-binding protein [Pedobacter cryoconitis]RAJ31925.1 ABC-2 type transport system ATP-binding protein [Pedobacter cryoconitis]